MASDSTTTLELDLGPGFSGDALRPGDAGYDEARRVFNGMIDRRPLLIACCRSTRDVVAAVDLARSRELPLSVHGGGHGVTGHAVADAGVMIDLRPMNGVVVDPQGRTAIAQAGLTWGQLDAATAEHGLAVTGGRVTHTGVAGLTLGSGSGWLERKYGLTCDSLVAADVVTADGRIVRASEDENADLFWALRGGGGNFGVVTAFHFRLHPVPPLMYAGMVLHPFARLGELARMWRDYMATAPDEVGSALAIINAPPEEFIPEAARGQLCCGLIVVYVGDPAEGERVLAPLVEWGPPAATVVAPMPYAAVQQLLDPGAPKGMRNYWTADFLSELSDEAIDTLAREAADKPSPLAQVVVVPGGGAIARIADDAMAFGERQAPYNLHYLSMWP